MKSEMVLLMLAYILLLGSCKKEHARANNTTCYTSIIGQWKLVKSSGGIAGGTYYPSAADQIVLNFNSDSSYSELYHGSTYNGRFSSMLVNSSYQLNLSESSIPYLVDTSSCMLVLSTVGISDGITSFYSH